MIYINIERGDIEMNGKLNYPERGRENLVKQGIVRLGCTQMQQYHCKDCGRNATYPIGVNDVVTDKERKLKSM